MPYDPDLATPPYPEVLKHRHFRKVKTKARKVAARLKQAGFHTYAKEIHALLRKFGKEGK